MRKLNLLVRASALGKSISQPNFMLKRKGNLYYAMTLKQHIDDIHDKLKKGEFPNEAAVCDNLVRRMLDALGWPRYEPNVVIREYPVNGTRVDFALCHPASKPLVFIEVKQVGKIEGAERQLFEYAFHKGVPIAILTDGREWHFFLPSGQGDYKERRVYKLDLIERNSEESATRLNRYLNYASIRTGKTIKAIEDDYRDVSTQRQIKTNLPEAWSKLLQEADEFLLEVVAEKVESLCGYRPTNQQTLEFLKSLKRTKVDPPNGKRGKRSRPRRHLVVTMPNGEKIDHTISATTFSEVIEKLGIDQVRNLERQVNGIPLISTSKDSTYDQRKSGQYYIMTNTDTKSKKQLLEEIATELRESLKVEIIEKS